MRTQNEGRVMQQLRSALSLATLMVVSVFALVSCDTVTGARLFTPETSEFDGAWIGELSVGFRTESCRLTRGGMRVRVEGGQISGQARFDRSSGTLVGVINDDGTIQFAAFTGVWARDDVTLEGSFGNVEATGTWGNEDCNGEWVLRRAR